MYDRYVTRIHQYVYYKVGSGAEAEDLTAQVFLRAWEAIGGYEWREHPFSAWLFRIAHNLVANWHRDQGRRPVVPLEETLPSQRHQPEAQAEVADEEGMLMEAIRTLPDDRQRLLIFKF
ncbi:MAG: sigma-70 family RNA polymerase sigma factor, partial [Anaerolineae bacterium]|nr:sigma-70 family RNA polymerase sigma factor [Anaerolineae bacterium]